MRVIDIAVSGHKIKVEIEGVSGRIDSDLHVNPGDPEEASYNAAIDGIESLILGHAMAGIDVANPDYVSGLETALDAIANHS